MKSRKLKSFAHKKWKLKVLFIKKKNLIIKIDMEKIINEFSIGLFLWQLFVLSFFVAIVYFGVKLYRKILTKNK